MPKDREGLHELTVAALRELAKKRLGHGTSKLRTKAQLIEALEAAAPRRRGKKAAIKSAVAAPRRRGKKAAIKSAVAAPRRRGKKAAIKSAAAPDWQDRAPAAEPVLALPLDARTLLVRWSAVPVRAKDERWELEVFRDGQAAHTIPVARQSRQARVKALVPGPVYRARLVACASNGSRRVIGSLSRPVVFYGSPQPVPSPGRFVRYSWSEPAASAQGARQPAPGSPLPGESELAALGAAAASRSGPSPTSPRGSFLSPAHPTSFAK